MAGNGKPINYDQAERRNVMLGSFISVLILVALFVSCNSFLWITGFGAERGFVPSGITFSYYHEVTAPTGNPTFSKILKKNYLSLSYHKEHGDKRGSKELMAKVISQLRKKIIGRNIPEGEGGVDFVMLSTYGSDFEVVIVLEMVKLLDTNIESNVLSESAWYKRGSDYKSDEQVLTDHFMSVHSKSSEHIGIEIKSTPIFQR